MPNKIIKAAYGSGGSVRINQVNLLHSFLEKEGVEKEKLEQLYAPIGLQLDSDTPEEIAVSDNPYVREFVD